MPVDPASSAKSRPHASQAAGSGAGSSTDSPYTAGRGPGFDPDKAPAVEPAAAAVDSEALLEEWTVDQVRSWLENIGDVAHATIGIGELDWAMTQADLKRIAPPATRILNRYQPTRAIAGYSDTAAVSMGMGLYTWRSLLERRAVKKARENAAATSPPPEPPPVPAPTMAASPDGGAPPGDTWAEQLRATRGGPQP
jgi:hypothetical protein